MPKSNTSNSPFLYSNSRASGAWVMDRLGRISLILAPLLTLIGWSLPHDSLSSFFDFSFSILGTAPGVSLIHPSMSDSEAFRYFLLPHYFIYASMPVFIAAALYLGSLLQKKAIWHELIGVSCVVVGAVYFVGALGSYLSAPIGGVAITGIVKVSLALCILVFVGLVILGFGLYKAKLLPKWAAGLMISGNIMILTFAGTENWMAVGSLFMLIGLLPASMNRFEDSRIQDSNC